MSRHEDDILFSGLCGGGGTTSNGLKISDSGQRKLKIQMVTRHLLVFGSRPLHSRAFAASPLPRPSLADTRYHKFTSRSSLPLQHPYWKGFVALVAAIFG